MTYEKCNEKGHLLTTNSLFNNFISKIMVTLIRFNERSDVIILIIELTMALLHVRSGPITITLNTVSCDLFSECCYVIVITISTVPEDLLLEYDLVLEHNVASF